MMRLEIYVLFVMLFCAAAANAQTPVEKLEIRDLTIEHRDGKVVVGFQGSLSKKNLNRNESLWLMPVITDGTYEVALEPIVLRSRRADVSYRRGLRADGIPHPDLRVVPIEGAFTYRSHADHQWWMQGASVRLESILTGCCTQLKGQDRDIATNILPAPEKAEPEPSRTEQPEVSPETEPEPLIETTGREMERTFSFVLSASEFDPDNIVVYDDDREAGIVIYYKAGGKRIEPGYASNRQALINLEAAIKLIAESPDSRVKNIVIAGFSSPEGSFEVNNRLAFERAVSVKEFIIGRTGIPADLILLHNGSADWRGLRLLVADSDMPGRDDILHIIDTVEIWDSQSQKGRMGEIMRYRNGSAYFYMKEHFFPKLRNGAFIRVYYEDK